MGRSSIRSGTPSRLGSDGRPGFRIDFEDWHSRDGGRDLIETSEHVTSVEAVQGEKSTLFLCLPEPVSKDGGHDAGDRSGVFVGNAFDGRCASGRGFCCSDFAELSGGLGRDSG